MKTLLGEITFVSNFKDGYFIMEDSKGQEFKCTLMYKDEQWDALYNYLSKKIHLRIVDRLEDSYRVEILN